VHIRPYVYARCLNGQYEGHYESTCSTCPTGNLDHFINVPVADVNFAIRNPGGTPTPGINTIVIVSNPQQVHSSCECNDGVPAVSLEVTAMHPIVLVHGWNSGPWAWGPDTPDPNGPCGAGQLSSDHGRTFINTLVAVGAPFSCEIWIGRQASTDQGARVLLSGGRSNEATSISVAKAAAEFGSRFAHIVAHSKGGLFTREFLDENAQQDPSTQVGIVSATTIDSPHSGSVLSDVVVAYNRGVHDVLGLGRIGYFFGSIFNSTQLENAFGAGNDDMTVAKVAEFNAQHPIPPPQYQLSNSSSSPVLTILNPAYWSTSGDADLDHSGFLSEDEAAPSLWLEALFRWNRLRTVSRITVTADAEGKKHAVPSPSAPQANDTAVTVQSARYNPFGLGFNEIAPGAGSAGPHLANHSTVLCSEIGAVPAYCVPSSYPTPQGAAVDVLNAIKFAELNLLVSSQ
jgi:pimeloyl-ACP methyl ester carboxylesterase